MNIFFRDMYIRNFKSKTNMDWFNISKFLKNPNRSTRFLYYDKSLPIIKYLKLTEEN
jgi:hypothetical protein